MITAEGGSKDWFSEHAFHPITGKEEKGSPSKLPAAESLTCLRAERERQGREGKAFRPKSACPPSSACPEPLSLVLSFLIRQAQFRVEALLIGHPSKTHAESKLPAIDWLSVSCATHHFQHKAQAAWHKL